MLSPKVVCKLLSYDPSTGICRWKERVAQRVKIGDEAGWFDPRDGRWRISIKDKDCLRARVAWCIMTGQWPRLEIDHINRKRSDDRWINLREVNRSNGTRNRIQVRTVHNLPCGIHPTRYRTGWVARWQVNKRRKESKVFYTIEDAVAFREAKLKELGLHDYSPVRGG